MNAVVLAMALTNASVVPMGQVSSVEMERKRRRGCKRGRTKAGTCRKKGR